MNITILNLIEGAKQATGLTVIIDVFRAMTVESYLINNGAKDVIPIGNISEAYAYKDAHPDTILVGERGGKKCEGFDFGNSPVAIKNVDFTGKTVIHTTSAGTQGLSNAVNAKKILTGSLVNAKAIANYIKRSKFDEISLVCMGLEGKESSQEDIFCAEYIKSLLIGRSIDMKEQIDLCKKTSGAKFFDPCNREVFPEEDFWLCVDYDKFDFVLSVEKGCDGFLHTRKI